MTAQANTGCDNLRGGAEDGKGRRQGFSLDKYICVIILKFIKKDFIGVFQSWLVKVNFPSTPYFLKKLKSNGRGLVFS